MRKKKFYTILIAVAFMITVVCSTIGLFSLQKVKVNFAVADNADAYAIQRELDGLLGDNLLFMDVKEVENILKDFHYMEVLSVQKQYPNVLNVCLKERREVYYIPMQIDEQTVYLVTNEQGFVLDKVDVKEDSRSMIELQLEGINVISHEKGQYLKTDDDLLLSTVFEMAKSVNLTDCIKAMSVVKPIVPGVSVVFQTYTGVKVKINKAEERGVEKVIEGFKAYDTVKSDYIRTFDTIEVTYNVIDEKIDVVWTSQT